MYAFSLGNEATKAAIDHLKKIYNVDTRAAALKRVIALATVLAKHADCDGNIHFITPDGQEIIVSQSR